MGSTLSTFVAPTTPNEIVAANNTMYKNVAKFSNKWSTRWPEIDTPWPSKGTFDPQVIDDINCLIRSHKAGQKTGKKGLLRREKRAVELQVLNLFLKEGQKLTKALSNRHGGEKIVDLCHKPFSELPNICETPFSHTAPPPYAVTPASSSKPSRPSAPPQRKSLYPQLPLLQSQGRYKVTDDDDLPQEVGEIDVMIKMSPDTTPLSSKPRDASSQLYSPSSKPKSVRVVSHAPASVSVTNPASFGGYDPIVRDMIAKAEREGRYGLKPEASRASVAPRSEAALRPHSSTSAMAARSDLATLPRSPPSVTAARSDLASLAVGGLSPVLPRARSASIQSATGSDCCNQRETDVRRRWNMCVDELVVAQSALLAAQIHVAWILVLSQRVQTLFVHLPALSLQV